MMDDAVITIYISDAIANTYRLTSDIANCEAWAQRATAEAEERGGSVRAGHLHHHPGPHPARTGPAEGGRRLPGARGQPS